MIPSRQLNLNNQPEDGDNLHRGAEQYDRYVLLSVAVAQHELHDAGVGQGGGELPERRAVCEQEITEPITAAGLQGSYVETWGIGEIERFPTKRDRLGFGNLPGLANAEINSEVSGASQRVSLARFARISKAESLDGSSRISKEIRDSIDHESASGTRRTSLNRCGGESVIRGPIHSRFDRSRKAASPVKQARY